MFINLIAIDDILNLITKVALVTGANRGIEYETCKQLAQLGLTVLLTARDIVKGQAAT